MDLRKVALLFCCLFAALFMILKSFSHIGMQQHQAHTTKNIEAESINKYNDFKKTKKTKLINKKQILKAQSRFKVKPQRTNLRRKNLARAPKPRGHKPPQQPTKPNQKAGAKKGQKNTKKKVAKKDDEKKEKKKKEKKEEVAQQKQPETQNKSTAALNNKVVDSKDLASESSEIETFITTTVPQPAKAKNQTASNNRASNDDDDEKDKLKEENNTVFTFDTGTTETVEALLERREFDTIDSLLRDKSLDKKTAYFKIVEFLSQSPSDTTDLTSLLNNHFFNIESTSILTEHLVNEETTLEEKQVSYSFLLQLINAWPENADAQQFNTVFVEGVNNQLTPPEETDLLPHEELFLQLSNSILAKFEQISAQSEA